MILGTVVKISTTVTVDGGGDPDSVAIIIYNPDGTEKVASTAMSLVSGSWQYIYQSATTDQAGTYTVIANATKTGNVASAAYQFQLAKKP